MNPDRFGALAEAYGGQLRRWPAAERAAAEALLARQPELGALLREAEALDGWLDAYAPPAADAGLRQRILEQAPQPKPLGRRLALWWGGAGLAAAGAAAGALIVMAAPMPGAGSVGWVYDQPTAFGALAPDQDG